MDMLVLMILPAAILASSWLLIRLFIVFLHVKYKLKISFDVDKFCQLKNIEICKLSVRDRPTDTDSTRHSTFQLKVDNVWLSSCFLNRNVDERLGICFNTISINYVSSQYLPDSIPSNSSSTSTMLFLLEKFQKSSFMNSLSTNSKRVIKLFLDYLGGVYVNRFTVTINHQLVHLSIDKFKVESIRLPTEKTKCVSMNMQDMHLSYSNLFGLSTNKFVLLNRRKSLFELEVDQAALNVASSRREEKFALQNKTSSSADSSVFAGQVLHFFKQMCLRRCDLSVSVSKVVFNKQNELNSLKIMNRHFDQLNLLISSLNFYSFKDDDTAADPLDSMCVKLLENFQVNVKIDNSATLDDQIGLSIDTQCDFFNFYVYNDNYVLGYLMNKYFQQANYSKKQSGATTSLCRFDRINCHFNNAYLNLVLYQEKHVAYKFGFKEIEFYWLGNLSTVQFNATSFILFRTKNKKLTDIDYLIDASSSRKQSGQMKHYWGNLINLSTIKFEYSFGLYATSLTLFMDRLFIEYMPDKAMGLFDYFLCDEIGFLKASSKDMACSGCDQTVQQPIKQFKLRLSVNSVNAIMLYENKHFLQFGLNRLKLIKLANEFNFLVDQLNATIYRLEDLDSDEIRVMIKYFQEENYNSDNLVFLMKSINLSQTTSNGQDYYMTFSDLLITWSFKTHYILNQTLLEPIYSRLDAIKFLLNDEDLLCDKNKEEKAPFRVRVMAESNILLNFLFDYSMDSSKVDSLNPKQYRYFNSSFSLIETISMILNDFYVVYDSGNQFNLKVREISAFVNVDDQSLVGLDDLDLNTLLRTATPASSSMFYEKKRQYFKAKNLNFSIKPYDETLIQERISVGASRDRNPTIAISYDSFALTFLYYYDFAKLFDHILNLNKSFYKIYNYKKEPKLTESGDSLSYDFKLSIKQFSMAIEDDPFEVRLSYNYALMRDEYAESVKRRQTLEQRRLIKENNLESRALEILTEKESEIYIRRSRQIYESTHQPIRTELFCFNIENLELYALADLNWHGREKCYEILRQIDECSPEPPVIVKTCPQDPQRFDPVTNYSILWCRNVSFCASDFTFLFRDYTQPLLRMTDLNLFGRLVGAELQAGFNSTRSIRMGVVNDLPGVEFAIERKMSPLKFYHDFYASMSSFTFAYGPCWEGCMAQFNLSLNKIMHPPRDPSKPLPWWDKSRLYLHGRLTCSVKQVQMIYHVSMDPYNRTEEMKLVWTNLYFDWTNMKMVFKGSLDVYLNTESKYDDCRLLHLPCLEMKINIDWLCRNRHFRNGELVNKKYHVANYHNHVILCPVDKLPVLADSAEHDSYSQFRSQNVNLTFSLVCKTKSSSDESGIKFYASTSRFLERIKNLLSSITRPTKRGILFGPIRPRKPLLSRHFNLVRFNIDLPKMNIIYWSSANEQYGLYVDVSDLRLNLTQQLDLIPHNDKLKRRPRPTWSIQLMKFNVEMVEVYLMSPLVQSNTVSATANNVAVIQINEDIKRQFNQAEHDLLQLHTNNNLHDRSSIIRLFESKKLAKNFFLKIDSIYYVREKLSSAVGNSSTPNLKKKSHRLVKLNGNKSEHHDHSLNRFSYSLKNEKGKSSRNKTKRSLKMSKNGEEIIGGAGGGPKSSTRSLLEPNMNTCQKLSSDLTLTNASMASLSAQNSTPKHNLVVKNLKCKWNNTNRDVIFILYDIYNKSKQLRHNLSSQALKEYDLLTDQIVQNYFLSQQLKQQKSKLTKSDSSPYSTIHSHTSPSDLGHLDTTSSSQQPFESLLNKLDSERGSSFNVFCNDESIQQNSNYFENFLYGLNSIDKMQDILSQHISIELINSQIKLSLEDSEEILAGGAHHQLTSNPSSSNLLAKQPNQKLPPKKTTVQASTTNTDDYLIISAARAHVVQCIHNPVWKNQRYLEKTSLSGILENMQYFATLNTKNEPGVKTGGGKKTTKPEYWLSDDIINVDNNDQDGQNVNTIIDTNDQKTNGNDKNLGSTELVSKPKLDQDSLSNSSNEKPSKKKGKRTLGMILKRRTLSTSSNIEAQSAATAAAVKQQQEQYYNSTQLQLIVSKCRCEFYMIDFDDKIPTSNDSLVLSENRSRSKQTNMDSSVSTLNLSNSYYFSNLFPSSFNIADSLGNTKQTLSQSDKGSGNQFELNSSFNEPMDCFTLIHHDLNLCTNSMQYKLIMEIVNNLVLYFRPRRKQIIDKQKSIKFNLQLSMGNLDSLKQYIQLKQIEIKQILCNLRALERKLYHLREKIDAEIVDYNLKYQQSAGQPERSSSSSFLNNRIYVIQELRLEHKKMEKDYNECKKKMSELSEELHISISCYKEIMIEKRAINLAQQPVFLQHVLQTSSNNMNSSSSKQPPQIHLIPPDAKNLNDTILDLDQLAQQSILNNEIPKRYEIWFKNTKWKLNEPDGKTGCAQFLMNNFLYTKVSNQLELDCVEHNLEIGSCKLQDLTAIDVSGKKTTHMFKDVLSSMFETALNSTDSVLGKSTESPTKASLSHQASTDVSERKAGLLDTTDLSNENVTSPLSMSSSSRSSYSSFSSSSDIESSAKQSFQTSEINPPSLANVNSSTAKIVTTSSKNMNMIRIYCKERPPVGIPVVEHLELNVAPLSIKLTNRFFKMMIKFFFDNETMNNNRNSATLGSIGSSASGFQIMMNPPANINDPNQASVSSLSGGGGTASASSTGFLSTGGQVAGDTLTPTSSIITKSTSIVNSPTSNLKNKLLNAAHRKKPSQSSLISISNINTTINNSNVSSSSIGNVNLITSAQTQSQSSTENTNNAENSNQLQVEDIEIMKQRSANNNTFLCIKIPEIQLLVSYRGSNRDKKNFKDLSDVSLLFPLFEVTNVTWTWLDLINALKSHVKKAMLSQALRHKFIKAPIQPMNKLINRKSGSHSLQLVEDHEKLAMIKLFGSKYIEKKSINPSMVTAKEETAYFFNRSIGKRDDEERASYLIESEEPSHVSVLSASNSVANENESTQETRRMGKIGKSNSTLSNAIKKKFLKLRREKTELNESSVSDLVPSTTASTSKKSPNDSPK